MLQIRRSLGPLLCGMPFLALCAQGQTITVMPKNPYVGVGQTQQFQAEVNGLASTAVTWSLTGMGTNNPKLGTITATGLYRAPASPPAQNPVTVQATGADGKTVGISYVLVEPLGPAVTSIAPSSVPVSGYTPYTVTITGSGFQRGAQVFAGPSEIAISSLTPTTIVASGASNAAGAMALTVKNPGSTLSNSVTMTFVPATPNAKGAPIISSQPQSQTIAVGQTATFSVTVEGFRRRYQYQWSKSGTAIRGATSGSYTTPAEVATDNGSAFTVTVADEFGTVTSKPATLTVLQPQTITFNTPGTQAVGTPLALLATASSGLAVSFASQAASVCTVSGTTATFVMAGTCTIQATQSGNGTWAAATPLSRSFTVSAAPLQPQTITFNTPGTQTVGTPLALAATASSGLAVSFASQTASVCTVSGTTATFVMAGTCTIRASQGGNGTWAAATPISRSFSVSAAPLQPQTITFNTPATQTVGTPLALSATASSGLAVSFASQTASVCTVSGTTATFVTAGMCTIQATQSGNGTWAAATPVSRSFTANAAPLQPQTITFNTPGTQTVGTPLALAATASSGLAVSFASQTARVCTVSGTAATFVTVGMCTIQATQAGNGTWAAATPISRSFTVSAAPLQPQTITFSNPGTQAVTALLTLSATASSGLPVSFASQTTSVCTVTHASNYMATFVTSGTCTIQATQAGNSTFAAATPVSQTFTVTAEAQTITFNTPVTQTVGTPLALSATATSGLAVSFASQTTSVCTVSGTTATFVTAGTCTIQASQAGNGIWAAATPASRSFTVNAAKPTITSFTATPTAVNSGSASTLSWVTTGAASIAITPGTFTSTSASGSTSVSPSSTTTYTLTATSTAGSVTATAKVTVSTGGPLTITSTSCAGGTQGASYTGCTITATGGTPPYTFSVDTSGSYAPLPEGMSLNSSTGAITSSQIGGQGAYTTGFIVRDAGSATASLPISFAINGNNAFLASIFPATSIFHHRVDAATTGLPVDTSPAAPMYSGYLSEHIRVFFGNNSDPPYPNGIPAFQVPNNQPDVAVSTTVYQSYFTSGPFPANAPVEGTSYSNGDRHVLIYQEPGSGPPALWEMWQGIYQGGPWTDSSNAVWPDVTSNALTTQGNGTTDAAGLPVAPLLVNADEVIGSGTPSSPSGTVKHPIRFTLNHMLNYWVWPSTESAGVGSCKTSGGSSIPTESQISQSSPPVSCTMTGPAGEIYRLSASVATPSCAATSPQAAIIITAFRNYGIILADNGMSGGLIGTPDARWNDNDLSCLTNIILSDFEPVNVSSLMVSNNSGATSH